MQLLAADDDNGDINDGTPHMTALYEAFNRHNIACPVPIPTNNGCANAPTAAPVLSASTGSNSVLLNWTAVQNANKYYVLRTEGPKACDSGKIKIATTAGTTYFDDRAMNGVTYYYSVMPVGSNEACIGPLSNCASAVPAACVSCAEYKPNSAVITSIIGGDNDEFLDNCESATAQFIIRNIGNGIANNTLISISSDNSFVSITTPMPINIGSIPVSGEVNASFNFDIGKGIDKASCQQVADFLISVQATGQSLADQDSFSFVTETDTYQGDKIWEFESGGGLEGWTISEGIWQLSTARVNPGGSMMSLHSSEYRSRECDSILSPEIEPVIGSQLVIPNWYETDPPQPKGWVDRANIWIIQGYSETNISPQSGKLYQGAPFVNIPNCSMGASPGWSGNTTGNFWGDSIFDLSSFAGQKISIKIKYMTDDYNTYEGIYVDDIRALNVQYQGCDQQSDFCNNAPGTVPDGDNFPGQALTISKSGSSLQLNWSSPGAPCITTDYGIYRGTLPWTGYNYNSVLCSTGNSTSATIPDIPESNYYLVVAQNEGSEGSYGLDSFNSQRSAASSPCLLQSIGDCN
ncbi:MAG: hypothetical protein A2Y62_14455 [Candidatus Fischerbacteria bacterium RBG_13_37_8]|uniref:Uncharacterized protein n=1 Tax=Candidatus Fischerbacteria bacterium RBG_13_37_8 TaxID=1817863 RepID=A0A1F5VPQ2_9BACT|nr:MAG: hypothetical protein A2Y62_14455 [Candidatus Fischerbacteria bacterium RBG_13_37_8]